MKQPFLFMSKDNIYITRIEFLKKQKQTFALYSDDVFLAEISDDTLVKFAITKGCVFSKKEFRDILEYNNLVTCLHQSYEYLSRRPHLKKELFTKLKNKNFPNQIIEQTIKELQGKKYLDDNEFIGMFIRERIREKKSGPLLIKKKLMEKGAPQDLIESKMQILFSEDLQIEIIQLLIAKKSPSPEILNMQEKQKLTRFLLGRGFKWTLIEQALKLSADY